MTTKQTHNGGPGTTAGPAPAPGWLRGHQHPTDDTPLTAELNAAMDACEACRFYEDPLWRAAELARLLTDLADRRYTETMAYAVAFLEAAGTEQAKTQTAKLATGPMHVDTERAAALVAAFQLLLKPLPEMMTP